MEKSLTFGYQGQTVAYQKTGSGKPLLVLHGWGSSSNVMVPLAQMMGELRTCYIPDFPGFGESDTPDRAWSVDDYADCIEGFIREVIGETTDLLAHSFGARITLKLCSRETGRELIDKVLITGGAGMKPRRTLRFYLKSYTARLLKAPFKLLPPRFRNTALHKLRNTSLWKSLGSSDYRKLEGTMREVFVKTVGEHLESSLEQVSHEVLLLWGKDDRATPLYQAERMETGIKHAALVVIENAGHYAFLDRPQKFSAIARAFFGPKTRP